MRNHKLLFLFTVTFFVLGFINIHFSLFGILCMTLPIVFLLKDRKKTWCQGYCPRSSLYTTSGKSKNGVHVIHPMADTFVVPVLFHDDDNNDSRAGIGDDI